MLHHTDELFWVKRYYTLESKGYRLRPRYHPDWKSSWTPGDVMTEEDQPARMWSNVMDAVKLDESKKVVLKHITDTAEIVILRHLLSVKDERNHTCPLIGIFSIELDEDETVEVYIVMPFLRRALDKPSFRRLGEVLTGIHQFLTGLEFMHSQNVAHRDVCYGNLMVDASQFIPEHHFSATHTRDGVNPIRHIARSSVPEIRYFFIDFGLSVWYRSGEPRLAEGRVGQDKTVPEWKQESVIYDPFKLDIYQLGNTILQNLLEARLTLCLILHPLTTIMTSIDPSQRPTATEAREYFESLTKDCDRRHWICVTSVTYGVDRWIMSMKNWSMTRKHRRVQHK
ncbi:kinase-like domain-containing protein [Mycena belliarum]|uniref:Kinase-like domain-containing protein n=1 Tax=Mycena belliarum TaxID=1033014 RepID=A0AAD6U5Y5_9AGAR|nr:kinase-like domain-containing protein [Mycena belliae]